MTLNAEQGWRLITQLYPEVEQANLISRAEFENNARYAYSKRNDPAAFIAYALLRFPPKGRGDYIGNYRKRVPNGPPMQGINNFGNFDFGYQLAAAGVPLSVALLIGQGDAVTGTYVRNNYDFTKIRFDDPQEQNAIRIGYDYYSLFGVPSAGK